MEILDAYLGVDDIQVTVLLESNHDVVNLTLLVETYHQFLLAVVLIGRKQSDGHVSYLNRSVLH